MATDSHGRRLLNEFSSWIPAILVDSKRQIPTGGVISPIARLMTTISPKWTGRRRRQ